MLHRDCLSALLKSDARQRDRAGEITQTRA
jgi:hypothetical protein